MGHTSAGETPLRAEYGRFDFAKRLSKVCLRSTVLFFDDKRIKI